MSTLATIIVAVVGSTALGSLIQFFVSRHDSKKNIRGRLDTLEKDGLRTQLLMLILMQPESKHEILTVGQHYFCVLHGDWYMTDVFNRWCLEHDQRPEWFHITA